MLRALTVLISGLTTAFAVPLGAYGQTTDPVTAEDAVVTDENGAISFRLINRSELAVTSWQVKLLVTYADGKTISKVIFRDGDAAYRRLTRPRRPDEGPVVPAGDSILVRSLLDPSMADTAVISVELGVRSAVFADGSSFGDPAGVDELLNLRAREHRAWAAVLKALEAGAALGGQAGIVEALRMLSDASSQDDFDHPLKQIMRRNLANAADESRIGRPAPEQFLRVWIHRVQQRLSAGAASMKRSTHQQ